MAQCFRVKVGIEFDSQWGWTMNDLRQAQSQYLRDLDAFFEAEQARARRDSDREMLHALYAMRARDVVLSRRRS
jgi:hypothetical protein